MKTRLAGTPGRAAALAASITCLAALAAAAPAGAQTTTDPSGDVLPCMGECSTHDQDLKSVTVDTSGGTVKFTIEQYGPFAQASPATCRCYFPQLHIFVGSTSPTAPDFYVASYNPVGSAYPYPMGLFNFAAAQAGGLPMCPGGVRGDGLVRALPDQVLNDNTIVYSFPAADIGSPGTFSWRVVEPAQSRCQTQ